MGEIVSLDRFNKTFNNIKKYSISFCKWALIAVLIGALGGFVGSAFHALIDWVTHTRMENTWLIFLLPIGGVLIAGMYRLFTKKGVLDTNRVIDSVRAGEKVPLVMVPLIFLSTVITHAFGGSAGREGAALQLGGGIGYNIGKLLRLNKTEMRIIVMTGMSAVFAALFGTPLTAAIFSLEVTNVGILHYTGLMPCIVSALAATYISKSFGLGGVFFPGVPAPELTWELMLGIVVLAIMCALVSMLFCYSINKSDKLYDKYVKNCYVRAFVGGVAIILLTILVGNNDYNGAGMDVLGRAIGGEAVPYAFLLKILFTAITISSGFKGGEIIPAFFVGSTFGCAVAPLLGMDASFCAAIGLIAVFCGVVNCPIASIILAFELFGADNILAFALACSVSYIMSGSLGLYRSQKIIYSKYSGEPTSTEEAVL